MHLLIHLLKIKKISISVIMSFKSIMLLVPNIS